MKTKIYEYTNTTSTGAYVTTFKPTLIRDNGGRGCWELEVDIPEELNPYETATGEICIEPEKGWKYSLLETLRTQREKPAIVWYTRTGEKKVRFLKIESRTEKSTAMYL